MISAIPIRTQQSNLMPLQAGTLPTVIATQIDINSIMNLMMMMVMGMMMKMMGSVTASMGAKSV